MVQDGWAEVDFGEWEGLSPGRGGTGVAGQMADWLSDPGAAPPGGESLAATSDRVLAALDSLLAGQAGGTVLIVSHVTPMKILLRHALLAPPAALRRMYLGVACLCEISWYAGGVGVVRTLNDRRTCRHEKLPGKAYAGCRGGRAGRAAAPGKPGEEGPGSTGQGDR